MSERTREGAPPPGAPDAAAKPHQRLPRLVAIATSEPDPGARQRLVHELIEALVAMRAPGDEAAEARALLAHLESRQLRGLKDDAGRDAHREAVETLLSLGFPHALHVSPEDLAQYRAAGELGAEVLSRTRYRNRASALAGLSQAGALYLAYLFGAPEAARFVAAAAALAGVGALLFWERKPKKSAKLPLALIGLSAAGLAAGALTVPALGVAALGTFAALVVAQWEPERR